jgi:hypothetical protein
MATPNDTPATGKDEEDFDFSFVEPQVKIPARYESLGSTMWLARGLVVGPELARLEDALTLAMDSIHEIPGWHDWHEQHRQDLAAYNQWISIEDREQLRFRRTRDSITVYIPVSMVRGAADPEEEFRAILIELYDRHADQIGIPRPPSEEDAGL